mmetsp:Transcript_89559/g.258291  ORF Transcript_89559/g.258291 Transcript_89559/m.258291 type:complete len:206 (-) Transcript_89559:423-1040(-)
MNTGTPSRWIASSLRLNVAAASAWTPATSPKPWRISGTDLGAIAGKRAMISPRFFPGHLSSGKRYRRNRSITSERENTALAAPRSRISCTSSSRSRAAVSQSSVLFRRALGRRASNIAFASDWLNFGRAAAAGEASSKMGRCVRSNTSRRCRRRLSCRRCQPTSTHQGSPDKAWRQRAAELGTRPSWTACRRRSISSTSSASSTL